MPHHLLHLYRRLFEYSRTFTIVLWTNLFTIDFVSDSMRSLSLPETLSFAHERGEALHTDSFSYLLQRENQRGKIG